MWKLKVFLISSESILPGFEGVAFDKFNFSFLIYATTQFSRTNEDGSHVPKN